MTIAGSDSGGGAGIQGDLKTMMALGCYGMSAITALTAQNGLTVAGIEPASPDFVALQITALLAGFKIDAAKTGMLFSAPIIEAVASVLRERDFPLVVDPVCVSQSGCSLLEDDAVKALASLIIPGCDLLTPNRPEAEALTGVTVESQADLELCGKKLLALGAKAVLIKGGHMPGDIVVTDWLFIPGEIPKAMPMAKIATNNNHGTGCALSAAIACGLGQKMPLSAAVARAQRFLNGALAKSWAPGLGAGPINHGYGVTPL